MVSRYFIELSYNGKNYHGWQIQQNAITIQEVLNNKLSTLLNQEIYVVGCGRTDTGVHASQFFAHFDIETKLNEIEKLIFKLNRFLPEDIAIHNIFEVNKDASSRFDAISRTYKYYISLNKSPFIVDTSYQITYNFDIDKMNKASEILYNYKDFSCFSKSGTQTATNNCEITFANWEKIDGKLIFAITANRFLRNMVRAIVGTLIEIGKGDIEPEEIKNIIKSKSRSKAGTSAPAKGLFLTEIQYPENITKL